METFCGRARDAASTIRRAQAGLTLVETMVAAALLLVGLLGTVKLVDVASSSQGESKAQEGATNLARELLEDAHDTAYKQVGISGWITTPMQGLANDANTTNTVTTPSTSSAQTTLKRRGINYTATVSWCSVDDQKDSYAASHVASINWCSDSTQTGGGDPAPEDFKRVTANVTYSINGNANTVSQTVALAATGGMVAPTVQSLCTTGAPITPAACAPTSTQSITSGTSQSFIAWAPGAADMRYLVNGTEVSSGITNNNDGSWSFAWNYASLVDGTYTIGAVAVDALGNRSQPMTISVKLARGGPLTAQNVVGGYNYVNPTGPANGGTRVVELQWDLGAEGSITGYEVLRGATSVCGGQTSMISSCIDTSPASSGSTTYTIKTWYQDAAGNAQSVSTTYGVTAPAQSVATQYWFGNSTGISQTNCGSPPVSGAKKDLLSTMPTGTDATWSSASGASVLGCMTPFTAPVTLNAGTGNISVSGWFVNTGTVQCQLQVLLYKNGALANVGNAYNGSAAYWVLAATSVAQPPSLRSETLNSATVSFAAGDQLGVAIGNFTANSKNNPANVCTTTTMYYNSSAHPLTITLPLTGGGSTLAVPNTPSGFTVTANADGTRTLSWTAPASSSTVPAADFYRIYRDGTATSNRVDTADSTSTSSSSASTAGSTTLAVQNVTGFTAGQGVLVDTGANQDVMTVSSVNTATNVITFSAGMPHAHAAGSAVDVRTVSWTDTNTGGSAHTYRVTATSANLGESPVAGPLTG